MANWLQKRQEAAQALELQRKRVAMAEALTMAQLRTSTYQQDVSASYVPLQNYEQGDYENLWDLYVGDSGTGMQLGSLFAQPIVKFYTAFEIGRLPTVVVREKKALGGASSGAKITELSQFANQFLNENHAKLIRLVRAKNLFGDAYVTFGPDRNLDVIAPYPAITSPGFYLFSDDPHKLHSFRYAIQKTVQTPNPKEGTKGKITVTRYYDPEQVIYLAEAEAGVSVRDYVANPKIQIPNTLGQCPVLLAPNNWLPGTSFGWAEFASCLPFMRILHDVLACGYQSQQYNGKPIMVITGIMGNVLAWFKKTFGIDVKNPESAELERQMMDFYNRHKLFAFADQVKAEFLESKYPIGATAEIAQLAIQAIVRTSMVPEFMFGVAIESANASVREQYVGLKAHIRDKQIEFAPILKQLIKWAFYYYSTVSTNPETGQALDTYGFISDPTKLDSLHIDLIYPPLLNSDEQLRIDALTLLQSMGGLSYRTAYENLQEFVPDAEQELERIAEEFADDKLPPKTGTFGGVGGGTNTTDGRNPLDTRTNTKSQRARDDKGNAGNNSGRTGGGAK